MSNRYRKGARVRWNWGQGNAEGRVDEVFERRVQRTIKGARIVRNGTKDDPAYLVVQDDGAKVLKCGSELD